MIFTDSVFVGVDPTSARRSFTYAALDREANLVALADGELEDILAFLAAQKSVRVAINAPSNVNLGLVRAKLKQEAPAPHQIRGAEFRLAEYELREHGIVVSGTPARAELCPAWMQSGFELHRKLEKIGFQKYPQKDAPHQVLETHPHACFCVLTGQLPLSKPTLEGRLQRQLILFERGMHIKDPMDFFEEITRYKMMKGIFPTELIYPAEMLDALVAAYTARLTVNQPDDVSLIGDPQEGQIVLPVSEIKSKYSSN
jgi:hypothetical protein